ncbi:hypothetical protein ACLOBI_07140 [Limosilactobacillus fermentum]|uniref:hypothetical protein n=1 Tax=Limosilactobacillus fermentum TaxID=1613 RepID=UPI003EBFB4D5
MSSTSDQMTQPSKKTRLIIDEIGVDTETGIIGRGHSYDNGKTFTVDKTIYGRIFHKGDYDQVWKGIQDKVKTVVEPAKSAADSAQSAADAAVASAQVTSDAVSAIASATAEAKQGANEAMSRAKSAWDVATGAKEAVTDFNPLLKSAQSDAGKALTQIADTASALSETKVALTSDVAVAKNLASTAQETADNAVKSASSVADDLTTVASQAKANASGITKVTSDVGLLQTTVADNSGNISTIKETAKQIQQAVSDNAGNITVAKQTADSAVTVASDAHSNATVAIQTASQASITAQNASGQAASAVLTANGAMTTASDAKSNATVAIQTASGASLTATNAQSDATIAKQTASEATVQASNAESDFAQLSIRANKIEANVANNSGAIASVQQTANGLTTTMADIKANGGGVNLVKDSEQEFSGKAYWFHGYRWASLNALTPGKTYTVSFSAKVDDKAVNCQQHVFVSIYNPSWSWSVFPSVPISTDYQRITYTFTVPEGITDANSIVAYLSHPVINGTSDSNYDKSDAAGTGYIKKFMLEEGTVAHTWSPAPEDLQNQFTQTKQTIDGITTVINDPKTGLNATYQTAAGNASTISNVKGDVAQLQTTANGLTSRVGSLESKTNTQQTAIDQNKAAIALKADQTTVDTLKGTVSQNTATLQTQANQIQAKVSASDVSGMLNGYATQSYTQSLVTQKADDWNLNLTSLKTDVNAIKTTGGGVNLAKGTSPQDQSDGDASKTVDWVTPIIATFDNPQAGQQYTISVNVKPNGGSWYMQIWDGTSPTQRVNTVYNVDVSVTQEHKFIATITWPSGSNKYLLVQLVNHNDGGQIVWNSAMIEEGTVAHTWSPAPSDMATVTSVTNLSATVDGIQAQVYNSDGSSKITQLSNLIQTKVGTDDFNNLKQAVGLQTLDSADINNMKTNGHYFVHNLANNPIGGWVYVDVTGNGNDRIRQDVYQDIGNKHKYRRWFDTNWTGWEEGATYSEINQLQDAINLRVTKGDLISQINLQAGTSLIQSNKLVLDAGTTVFTGDAFIPSAAISSISADKIMLGSTSLYNSDGTMNLVNTKDGTTSKITVTQGNVDFDGTEKNASIIHFASDNNTNAFTITPVGATVTPTLFFERFDQPPGHWLGFTRNETENEGVMFHTWDDSGERFSVACHARFDKNLRTIGTLSQGSWDGTPAKPEAGVLTIKNGNTIWSGSDYLAIGTNLTGSYGNVMARAFSQQSTLSSKTNIETVDPKYALDLVNRTDILSYQYKTDVAQGKTKRYTSLILDDVNDVSKYYAPDEFANEERTGRDDGSAVGYLFLAVQELTRRIKTLEEKLNG